MTIPIWRNKNAEKNEADSLSLLRFFYEKIPYIGRKYKF